MVRLKLSMPSRSTSSSTGHGSWYMPAMCRSSGMGRADGGRPPSWSITPTRARSPAPAVSGILAEQADGAAGALLQALGAFDGGGLAGAVGSQQGGDLPAFGDEGNAADHPEHLAVEGGQRTNILDEPADGQDGGFGGSHHSILRDVVRSAAARSRPTAGKPRLTGTRE